MDKQYLYEKYEMIVGLEVHAELRTASKIFCACSAAYGGKPNTQICPVCLGVPGTMPVLNGQAVRFAIAAGLVTDCTIARRTHFDRKHYFYPDLPKGYQITQYDEPLCTGGFLTVETETGERRIGITRIHLEEDAGKLTHDGGVTKIDYNRCGVPLIEIVSEPDIRSADEARAYLRTLRERLVFAGISDCRMNEGSMRCDINLSVRLRGTTSLGVRTEIKNVNSIAFAGKAIVYEFARQTEILEAGGEITPETRRYDEASGTTVLMRKKESAADYRYMREPDLPALRITKAEIGEIRASLPMMPDAYRRAFASAGVSAQNAQRLTETPAVAAYFSRVAELFEAVETAANLLIGEAFPEGEDAPALPAESLSRIAQLQKEKKITAASARKLVALCADGSDPDAVAEREKMFVMTDEGEIEALVREAIAENPDVVRQIREGKEKAKQVLVGVVMKKSGGRADASVTRRLVDAACAAAGTIC